MPGNTLGKLFTVTSFGESHGTAIGCIVDGCPPGLELDSSDLQAELERRRPGKSRHTSQRREPDQVEILSGTYAGTTTGTPIGLIIYNQDARSKDYTSIRDKFRPGHADYTYLKKYGLRDYRGGGRSSARETAMRVAAGAIAKKYLREKSDILIRAYLSQLGSLEITHKDWDAVESNPFFCPDAELVTRLESLMDNLRKLGDSTGARVTAAACNLPAGLGEPVFDRLDADIAHAMMSINAVKGVEIGAGFHSIAQTGSQHRDEMTPEGFLTNHAGGILGGISTGQELLVNVAFKPTSSIRIPGKTVDVHGNPCEIVTTGRHDPCVGIRGVPIVEAMLAIVVMDHLLRHQAQNLDVKDAASHIPSSAL